MKDPKEIDILKATIFRHMIDFTFFKTVLVEFAWWARGNDFALFDVAVLEITECAIALFRIQIAKVCFSITIER